MSQIISLIVYLFLGTSKSTDYRYFITTQGLNPVDTSFWLTPAHNNGTLYFLGSVPNNSTGWYIAEWNIPNQIALIPYYSNDTNIYIPCNYMYQSNISQLIFWAESINGLVCVYKNIQTGISEFELIQNGNGLQCGVEYDLFLSPVTAQYKNYPVAFIGKGDNAPYLNQLSQLNLQFKIVMIKDYDIIFHCGTDLCGSEGHIDYGYITIGVILSNIRHQQTIFYQIQLFDTRDNLIDCKTGGNSCVGTTNWYFRNNPYGVNDNVPIFGYKCLNYTSNRGIDFKQDMLQRFVYIITVESVNANIQGLDRNVSNWQIGGMYFGSGIQGMTSLDLMVTNIDLVGVLN